MTEREKCIMDKCGTPPIGSPTLMMNYLKCAGNSCANVSTNEISEQAYPNPTPKQKVETFAKSDKKQVSSDSVTSTGMSTGMKIGIGLGALLLIGGVIWYFKFRKK